MANGKKQEDLVLLLAHCRKEHTFYWHYLQFLFVCFSWPMQKLNTTLVSGVLVPLHTIAVSIGPGFWLIPAPQMIYGARTSAGPFSELHVCRFDIVSVFCETTLIQFDTGNLLKHRAWLNIQERLFSSLPGERASVLTIRTDLDSSLKHSN